MKEMTKWIRSQAAKGEALNLHAVMRERPDLLEQAFGGPSPRGWRRSLIDAGVNPYKIVHQYEDHVECAICGSSSSVLGSHLKLCHGITGDEYKEEFGPDCELSSESFRAAKFSAKPIAGIAHWEGIWSRYYVVDWIIRLHDEGRDLNYHSLHEDGKLLAFAGWYQFGSWDAALRAAGFNPDDERAIPVFQQWTKDMVIEKLQEFAVAKKGNWRLKMSMDLRLALGRIFGSPKAAAKAAGLKFEDINPRAIFSSRQVTDLVKAIRKLENLKGLSRQKKLRAIYHKNDENRRIIQNHYESLRKLAIKEGIDLRVVAPQAYRDKADVIHDLDLIEQEGKILKHDTLRDGHSRLYNIMLETGWGLERLVVLPRPPKRAPRK